MIDRAADDLIPGLLLHRHGFARNHGFIDGTLALGQLPIHGNLLTRTDSQDVAALDFIQRDFLFVPVSDNSGGRWGQGEQFPNGAASAPSGPQFQDLTEQHERDDDRRRLEIDFDVSVDFEIVREQAGEQHGKQTIEVGRTRADGDEREHVEIPGHDGPETSHKERPSGP